jgi:hypothetical protein
MRFPRLALRLPLLALVFLSAAAVGCKQDIGERCELGSDCASGYCNYSTASIVMTSAQGRVCTGALPPFMSPDAGPATMSSPDARDASEAGDGAATPSDAPSDLSSPDSADHSTDATESDTGG